VEVQGKLGVVLLNDDPGGLLNRLGTDPAHLSICNIASGGEMEPRVKKRSWYTLLSGGRRISKRSP
jgi:hypothetical protein